MQIKATLALAFTVLFSSVAFAAPGLPGAELFERSDTCAEGGKHIGGSCIPTREGDFACGDHKLLRCEGGVWKLFINCPSGTHCEKCVCVN